MSTTAKQQTAERNRYRDGWLAWARLRNATAASTPDRPADNASAGPADVMGHQASAGDDASANTRQRASRLDALPRDQASDARNLKLAQRDAALELVRALIDRELLANALALAANDARAGRGPD